MIPEFATHYHLPDREPFLSLSDLDGDIEHPVFVEMLNKHREDTGYRRIYGKKYLEMRMEAENKLRRLFEHRGGKPNRHYPLYFILGESQWFGGLNEDHEKISVPLSEFPNRSTSVTYPDSYIAMSREDKPYFEKVYFLDELEEFVSSYGLPEDEEPELYERYWVGDFEKYIEIQVWDDSFAETCRKKWLCQQSV
jgi:hypothetical protein